MPKKGLIAIPGTISASGSDGLGAMQMPPVSVNTQQNKASSLSQKDNIVPWLVLILQIMFNTFFLCFLQLFKLSNLKY